jgi:uncharacterized CHY-type Zn-finger protein
MGKINAYCGVCGKGYYMCLACKDVMQSEPWKTYTDTSEHYKIFQILYGNSTGVYTDIEARDRLLNVDLSDKDTFLDNVQKHIDRLLSIEDEEKKIEIENVKEDEYIPITENTVIKTRHSKFGKRR